jgi:Nitrate and nitrite sensing
MSSLPRGLCGSPVWEADRVANGRRVRHLGVLVSVAVLPLVVSCSNDDEGRSGPEETPTTVEQATGLRDLVSALQDERNAAFVTITGVAAPSDGSVADADVRGTTDETLADLDPAVVESLDGLTRLRSDVDSRPSPADLTQVPFADEIFDRYSELIASMLDASDDEAMEITEPEARRGAQLLSTGLRQTEVVAQLIQTTLIGPITGQPGDSEWLTELASLHTQFTNGQATLDDLATGSPYEPAVDQLSADLEEAGFLAWLPDVLNGAQPDIARLLDSVSLPPGHDWIAFLDRIEDIQATGG